MMIFGVTLHHFLSDVGFALIMGAIAAPFAVLIWFAVRLNFGWGRGADDEPEDRL